MGLISYIFSSDNRRHIKKLEAIANKVELLADKYKAMSDEELRAQTAALKARLTQYETLDDILPDAFAVVREAGERVLGMRHFHVQLLGGICLHQGRIAEMRTGEGKTLVATLPTYLNALSGKGVHVVTVNDYLARRDAEWMGKIHRFLGLTVGVSVAGMNNDEKRAAYACDVTYCTNNELGFDYLRDNMVGSNAEKVQRGLDFAIIDEVDSILIDEARTPLIISGRGMKSSEMYITANRFAKTLFKELDFEVEEKKKAISLTPDGVAKAERYFAIENLSDMENTELNHYINNAMRAQFIMKRDSDYIVENGEVIIVDEFTGRKMIGRRYSDGLHQAIEAKENVNVRSENKTLATITFQNFFKLYKKISGMTGTAKTEEAEFNGIYSLDVVTIPTNMPMIRQDENDVIFTTVNGKEKAIVEDIAECYGRGQPVLVGTVSIEKSEEISALLKKRKISHNILNAKNHEREAEIVAQAGRKGQVTIATNMAGRGTDITLGGNPEYMAKKRLADLGYPEEMISNVTSFAHTADEEILKAKEEYRYHYKAFETDTLKEKIEVMEVGGLRIIGTERHESRRIDNQLRGRAGRQGDPGSSIFYISLEDDLARLFGGDKLQNVANMFKADEDTPFSMGLLTKQIENAQRAIEGRNYSTRKQVLEYDEVMNEQRKIIYSERNKVLSGENMHEQVMEMLTDRISTVIDTYCDPTVDWHEWDVESVNSEIGRTLLIGAEEYLTEDRLREWTTREIKENIQTEMLQIYDKKVLDAKEIGVDFSEIERILLLRVVDDKWMDHIDAMDALRKGISLRAYGNQDPVVAYKKEGFEMFSAMIDAIQEMTVVLLMKVNIARAPKQEQRKVVITKTSGGSETTEAKPQQAKTTAVGRNDLCPCGSGKKYKYCCGK